MRSIIFVLIIVAIAIFLPGGIFAVGAFLAKRAKKWNASRKLVA